MRKIINRFKRDVRGSVALVAGLSAIPMALMAGVALDIQRAYHDRTALQAAADGAALALGASDLSDLTGLTTSQVANRMTQLTTKANQYISANYTPHFYHDTALTVNVTVNPDSSISLHTQHDFPTSLMRIIGINKVELGADSQVMKSIAQTRMEVALVLDNTGSMAGTKISNLKTAASNFVDTLQAASQTSTLTNPVKVSLVPYTMTVNVGTQYKTASWITGTLPTAYGSDIFTTANTNRFTVLSKMGTGGTAWGGCVETRPSPYDSMDTAPASGTPATMYVPFFSPDEPDTSNAGYVNNYLTDASADATKSWTIKQGDPAKYTVKPKAGSNGVGYTFGPNAGCIAQPLIRLTTNFASVKTGISGMTAQGDTTINAGLLWGWHTLSPNGPFADGVAYDDPDKTNKIIVLMTDGQNNNAVASNNNASFYGGSGYIWQGRFGITSGTLSQRRDAMDARTLATCTNAKAAGVVIYAITLDVSSEPAAKALLQQCASSLDKYYDVADASTLDATFKSIGYSIRKLYVSR